MRSDRGRALVIAVALACYTVHAARNLAHGEPENLFWACHLAVLLVALGFALRSPALNAIGFLWSMMGNPLWLLDLAGGGEFLPTSLLTHVGGLVLGVAGIRRFGMPSGAWWKAGALFALLQILCRAVTPEAANVNVAFRVWAGWESTFPSYGLYLAVLYPAFLAFFFAVERAAQRFSPAAASRSGNAVT